MFDLTQNISVKLKHGFQGHFFQNTVIKLGFADFFELFILSGLLI